MCVWNSENLSYHRSKEYWIFKKKIKIKYHLSLRWIVCATEIRYYYFLNHPEFIVNLKNSNSKRFGTNDVFHLLFSKCSLLKDWSNNRSARFLTPEQSIYVNLSKNLFLSITKIALSSVNPNDWRILMAYTKYTGSPIGISLEYCPLIIQAANLISKICSCYILCLTKIYICEKLYCNW